MITGLHHPHQQQFLRQTPHLGVESDGRKIRHTDAKPRAGYEVAVIEMTVDNVGLGKGTMTAAARVKPGGEAGVRIDDYAEKPIQLVTVSRKLK